MTRWLRCAHLELDAHPDASDTTLWQSGLPKDARDKHINCQVILIDDSKRPGAESDSRCFFSGVEKTTARRETPVYFSGVGVKRYSLSIVTPRNLLSR